MNNNAADTLSKLLECCNKSEIEIEARIRKQLVNRVSKERLVEGIGEALWDTEVYSERRRISRSSRKCAYRQRQCGDQSMTICKSSVAKEDVNDRWCTLHVSVEVPVPSMSNALAGVEPVQITRQRTELDGHYVDVIYDGRDYRVEVEVCSSENFDRGSTLAVVERVCALLQGSPRFVGFYDWLTVMHITKHRFGTFCIDSGNYQKPHTMTFSSLSDIASDSDSWVVTQKVDGERRFIVVLDGRVFSVGLGKDVRHEGSIKHEGISIIDCEYTSNMYHIFDAAVKNGIYIGDMGLYDRLCAAQELCDVMYDMWPKIRMKEYHDFHSFDRLCDLCEMMTKQNEHRADGVVFLDVNRGYMQTVQKWKQYSTIDLMVTRDNRLITCDDAVIDIPVDDREHSIGVGIWEFDYDSSSNTLYPRRPRPDKPRANSKKIVYTNMHYAVPGSLFSGVGCYLMRKYHNRVKHDMIKSANDKDAVILDIGTGQGGDVSKWDKARKVYCIEPSKVSILEMQRRYESTNTKVEIIAHNVHLRDLDIRCIDKRVDIFTAFFCMNLFQDADWESLSKLIKMRGSSKCRLLVIAMTNPKDHKGGCFSLAKGAHPFYSISIHGTRILGLQERAIDPSELTKRMNGCGLKLMKRNILNEYDFMTKEERRLSAMYEMFAYKRGRL